MKGATDFTTFGGILSYAEEIFLRERMTCTTSSEETGLRKRDSGYEHEGS